MPSLIELQRELRTTLLSGSELPPSMVTGGAITAHARLEIYANNVFGNLTKALRLTFPAIERLVVGPDFFAGACAHFISADPPASADLYEYGGAFAAFLEAFEPAQGLAYLPDVTRLEWAVNRALHAILVPALAVDALRKVAEQQPAELRFTAHPSLSLLALASPAKAIWEAVLNESEDARAQRLGSIDLGAPGDVLVVLHGADGLTLLNLSPAAFEFARALTDGLALADALALIPSADAAPLLGDFIARGFFIRCDLRNQGCIR